MAWSYDQEEKVDLWHRDHPWIEKDEPDDELIRRIRDGEPVEAHNAGFEFNVWNEAFTREFPEWDVKLKIEQMHCSAAKASCLSLPRGLEDAITAVGLPDHKIADGKRLINKLSKPMIRRGKNKGDGVIIFCEEEEEHRRNWEYCKGDVKAERGLSNFCPEMSEQERKYWLMDFRMNLRGIKLDRNAAEKALGLAALEATRLNGELKDITGGLVEKGSQRIALLKWANGRLVELEQDPLANTKADTLSFALDGVPTKAGDEAKEAAEGPAKEKWDALGEEGARVNRALRICMEVNRSSVAKYKRMIQSVCPDDALHDIMLYNGADRPVSGDAEVLTRQGWQRIDEWQGGEIAQWAHRKGSAGEITFAPATRAKFAYAGDMVRMIGPSTELLCTPDHKIPLISCRDNLTDVAAGGIGQCNWALPLAGSYSGATEPAERTRLIVMYQADGRTPEACGSLSLHFRKPRKIERCKALLTAASLAFEERVDGDGSTNIKIVAAPEWLRRSKEFGGWLLAHAPAVFIDELKHWDGCTDKRNAKPGTSYATCSKINAEWVQTMAALAGTRAHIEDRGIRNPNWNRSYRVHVHNSGARSWLKKGWTFDRERLDGTVYCARTQTGYFLVRYHGTIQVTGNTGRWSGKGVQPHNFVRGYGGGYKDLTSDGLDEMGDAWRDILSLDRELITMMWGEPMVCLAKACRGALIARDGKELYAADFNAIEARKLAWLSNCAPLLTLFNTKGGDPYCDMATAIYKRTITKADKSERSLGKKAILGLGYSMGWEKFQATVYMDEGIWLDDEFCQMVVSIYRKEKYPEVPALWRASEKAAIAAVVEGGTHYCGGDELGIGSVSYFMSEDRNFLHCQLPSGRLLAYLYPRVNMRVTYRFAALNARGRPTTINFPAKKSVPQHQVRWHAEKLAAKQGKTLLPDPPESFVSPHLSFMGRDTFTKQWKRCGTHGGSLVENYDQASSRDLLAEAMLRVDEMDQFDLLLSIHDEVIAEADIGTCAVNHFEAIMSVVPKWCPGMPIAAEGWVGPRLRK